jgi:hypothetical protein
MTTIRNTAIAAVAAITIAASMSSPANAWTTNQKIGFGVGLGAVALGAAIASGNAYYGDDGYRGGRHYRRSARHCARRFGWHTWRWERCMRHRGY